MHYDTFTGFEINKSEWVTFSPSTVSLATRKTSHMSRIDRLKKIRPGHTNAFSKVHVSVFISTKTKQIYFYHTSVFVSFSPVYNNSFSFEDAYFLIR